MYTKKLKSILLCVSIPLGLTSIITPSIICTSCNSNVQEKPASKDILINGFSNDKDILFNISGSSGELDISVFPIP